MNEFVPKLIDQERKVQILEQLRMVEVLGVIESSKTKKGLATFKKWQREKMDEMETLNAKEKTVFDKLEGRGRSNTLFDKLRYKNGI